MEIVFAIFFFFTLRSRCTKYLLRKDDMMLENMAVPGEILGVQWAIMQLKDFAGLKLHSLMIITPGDFCPSNFSVSFIIYQIFTQFLLLKKCF